MNKNNSTTIVDWFYKLERETPNQIFLRQPYADIWKEITYKEAGQSVRKMVTALRKMGLQKGDHISIFSKNCYHWVLADLAITAGGFISVPFYPTLDKNDLKEVVNRGDIKAIFIGRLENWGDRIDAIPKDVPIIRFPKYYEADTLVDQGNAWDELEATNEPAQDLHKPTQDDIWKILFTSGTTGTPKGAIIKHSTISNAMEMIGRLTNHRFINPGCAYFSYLPLNHAAETLTSLCFPIYNGGSISFAESLETFADNLRVTQPGFFLGVPRVYTKFYLGILNKIPEKKLNLLLKIPIISGIIKKKLKAALGLSNANPIVTGAAITPTHVKAFFKKLDIHLMEAYGATETIGVAVFAFDAHTPLNSVGKPIPGIELKVESETEEIIIKGPTLFSGYYNDPILTDKALSNGWYRTGDRGTIDDNGFLHITGRVTDAFKTTKGEFIIPNKLEEVLNRNNYIEQVCVAGITSAQPVALVNLSEIGQSVDKSTIQKDFTTTIDELNQSLENYTKVSTIVITPTWTIENELITPTLKVKRSKIDETYKDQYADWHECDKKIVWIK